MSKLSPERVAEQAHWFRWYGRKWPDLGHVLVFLSHQEEFGDWIGKPQEYQGPEPDSIAREVIVHLGLPADPVVNGRFSWRFHSPCVHIFHGVEPSGLSILELLSRQSLDILGDDFAEWPTEYGPWAYDRDDALSSWIELVYRKAWRGARGTELHADIVNLSDRRFSRMTGLFEVSARAIESEAEFRSHAPSPRQEFLADRNELCFRLYCGPENLSLGDIALRVNQRVEIECLLSGTSPWPRMTPDTVDKAIRVHARRLGQDVPRRRRKRDPKH
ncbi:MAG: hypothetical protein NVSMB9_21330 [Isosphaeraceae bacterium]